MHRLNGAYALSLQPPPPSQRATSSASASPAWLAADDDHLREHAASTSSRTRSGRASARPAGDWPWTRRRSSLKPNACSRPPARLDWLVMAQEELVVHGAREHNLKDITVRLPRACADLRHRPLRLRQVEPRLRHDLRRGPAPLRREPLRLRAPVPADDGEAGRRLDRRPLARRSRSTRRRPAATRARRSAPSPRSTTTCACSTRGSASRTARSAAGRSPARARRRSSTRSCSSPTGTRFTVNAPVVRDRKGEYRDVFEELRAEGFTRVKVDGEQHLLEEPIDARQEVQAHDRGGRRPPGDEGRPAAAPGAVGRDRGRARRRPRRRSTCSTASRADLLARTSPAPSTASACPSSSRASSRFNSPHGACPRCTGLGAQQEIDPDLLVPDPTLSIGEGALVPWSLGNSSFYESVIQAIADRYEIDLERRGRTSPRSTRTSSCSAPTATRSTSSTATGWAASARTCSPSRASSRASSAATARPTRASSASGSRST